MQPQGQIKLAVKRFHTSPTLDQWLSHSVIVPMASGPEDSVVDDTSSSLGDSTYDFLDDKSGFTTDDEDTSNLTRSISSSVAHDTALPAVHESQDTAHTARPLRDTASTDDAATEDHGNLGVDEHCDIKLDEPVRISTNATRAVEGSHTLRIFDQLEVKELKSIVGTQAPMSQLKATVRQTMAGHTLSLGRPFKVLYVGDISAKDTIIQKIGSALTASVRSSMSWSEKPVSPRFNVVPISSFGKTRSPEVLLVDSLGIEIKVDHCESATFARKEDSNDSISLHLSNHTLLTSIWSSPESKFTVLAESPGWELPQLAVFYLSDIESMEVKQTRRFARSFMSRHKISCLVITQSQLWGRSTEAITLDYLTPHLCIETTGLESVRPRIIKRLPIDLPTFLNLDAVQVNRNLACLIDASSVADTKIKDLSIQKASISGRELIADETGRCSTKGVRTESSVWIDLVFGKVLPIFKSPISALFLLAFIFSCLGVVPYLAYSGSTIRNTPVFPPVRVSSLEHSKAAVESKAVRVEAAVTSHPVSTTPLRTTLPNFEAARHANTDLASFLLDSHALTPNNSAKFKVHVVGDRHVVLRPPHWFMRYRKAPKLIFKITRKNKAVEHELSMLFDGVYALKVSREDAYGLLDVSVRTTSKPKINETFQIDFGNSWLRIAGWKGIARTVTDSIRGDVQLAQTSLNVLSMHANTLAQRCARDVIEKVHAIRRDIGTAKLTTLNRTASTAGLVLAQTRNLSRSVSRKLSINGLILKKQLSLQSRRVWGNLFQYAGNRAAALKQTVDHLSHAFTGTSVKAMGQRVKQLRHDHVRSAQKRALKAWWKLAGVPKKTPGGSTVKGVQRKKVQRPKKAGGE
ncbi:MAG: hypothetical protein Q9195_003461 [Heterodermia aff. obscurata]